MAKTFLNLLHLLEFKVFYYLVTVNFKFSLFRDYPIFHQDFKFYFNPLIFHLKRASHFSFYLSFFFNFLSLKAWMAEKKILNLLHHHLTK